jgi:non-ribosomal peptide synthetase-like protein
MVPTYLEELCAFPLLTSGKVNRKELPVPQALLADGTEDIAKPETALEHKIAGAWARVLGVRDVGAEQDFFLDLGGHSLLAAKLSAELRNEEIHVPVRVIYDFPTVRKLAKHAEARDLQKSQSPERPSMSASAPVAVRKPGIILVSAQILSMLVILTIFSTPVFFIVPIVADMLFGRMPVLNAVAYTTAIGFAFWPVMIFLGIAAKWLIIGRYKPGRHPLWGSYYFRWWLVSRLQTLSGAGLFVGTPLMPIYYRLMGAKVGRHCALDSGIVSAWDLITIGDHTSIGADTQLLGAKVEDGYLVFGSIRIGKRCFIGLHCALGLNTTMGDSAKLDDQSLLPDGDWIWRSEATRGSPARPADVAVPGGEALSPSRFRLTVFTLAQILSSIALSFFGGLPALGMLLGLAYVQLNYTTQTALLVLAAMVPLATIFYCFWIAFCKFLVLPNAKPGVYKLHTFTDLRFWLAGGLMRATRAAMLPIFTTLYLPPWMRLLGAKIGKYSEMSTVFTFLPEFLSAADGSFFADGSILGGRRTHLGRFEVGINSVGRRSFIGNSAILPPGASIGEGCLLGVLSTPPEHTKDIPDGTDWLGSPGFRLPNRQKVGGFNDAVTYVPTAKLYLQRAVIDACRILIPAYTGSILGVAGLVAMILLYQNFEPWVMLAAIPALVLIAMVLTVGITVGLKWLIMGRFKPVIVPLWSPYVWFNEMINGIYESVMAPTVAFFFGTPVAPMLLRLLGCKIGRHCFINTSLFSEFDLVRVGNGVSLNFGAVIQNHLFEDRIMKSSYLDIGDRCTVGNMAVVLYDSRMEPGAVLGPLSLLMKAEVMPAKSRWHGIPTVQG